MLINQKELFSNLKNILINVGYDDISNLFNILKTDINNQKSLI